MTNPHEIKKFIDLIKNTDIEELCFEQGDTKISIKRQEVQGVEIAPAESVEIRTKNVTELSQQIPKEKQLLTIKSPMVGTFYRAESLDHPPFVVEGDHVIVGQKVAVIEAMRIMKDVISTVEGKITKILIEDGKSVEFGQELFLVEPGDRRERK